MPDQVKEKTISAEEEASTDVATDVNLLSILSSVLGEN